MRTIKLPGETFSFPSTNRELKRYLLSKNIWANTVKWLGRYDIAMNERLYPTGIKRIDELTFQQWESLINRINLMPEDQYQVINGNIAV